MKKNLLTMALAAGVLLPVSAQWNQVGGTVKIKPNTLKYVAGDYAVNGGTVSNEGNVNVQGGFEIGTASGVEFRNEFENGTSYGQLILKDGEAVSGVIHDEFKLNNGFAYHAFAVPFAGYKSSDLVSHAEMGAVQFLGYSGAGGSYDVNRYKNPIFHWDFTNFVFDTPAESDDLVAGEYYEINNFVVQGGSKPNTTDVTTYIGTPNNFSAAGVANSITLPGYDVPSHKSTNMFGEAYGTYITDPSSTMPTGWSTPTVDDPEIDNNGQGDGYGNNIYYLANPYTSNINLKDALTGDANFSHIIQTFGNAYTREDGNGDLVDSYEGNNVTISTANALGDQNAFVVRPFHTFIVKMGNMDVTGSTSIDFSNVIKTFEGTIEGKDAPSYRVSNKDDNATDKYYQVGMDLYTNLDYDTGKRFYVVASDVFGPAGDGLEEAYNIYLGDSTGVYTLQENADGTVNEELSDQPVYINGINATDYVAKPVAVVFQTNDGGGTYKLKARFNDELANSNYKYYFEDKLTGTVEEVTPNYEYTFTQTETTRDRFAMYWNEYAQLGVDDAVQLTSETIVYKAANEYKVRFSKDWKTADVYVYNMLGQLVHTKKGVSTNVDYTLPLNNAAAAYVVKAIGDNGEVVTKKVIK